MQQTFPPDILYEDASIFVCVKPAGLPVQSAKSGQKDLVSELKNYRVRSGGDPYIGLVHRLDQPVRGIMLFAKTKTAAAHLSRQVSSRQIGKEYMAVVCGLPDTASDIGAAGDVGMLSAANDERGTAAANDEPPTAAAADRERRTLPPCGELHDYLLRDGRTNTSRVVPEGTPGAKEALLSYEVVKQTAVTGRSLVHITLRTGRHHQIRVQFAHAGFPLYADTKYGQPLPKGSYCPIALCSYRISFTHPDTGQEMVFELEEAENLFSGFLL
ncbi:MAG: RluA family pseudouridine synthase [Lachnospiraceae bacterium]|nr:RluA family pseudouridine synthase [Lachnospiraceae bacterium]